MAAERGDERAGAKVRPGDRLGPFVIKERLGQGGMGTVYRAVHERLEKVVAVKVLAPELASRPALVQRFEREAKIQAGLDHPNIVQVNDFISAGGLHAFVMEHVDGVSLEEMLLVRGERFPPERCVDLILPVLDALEYAHGKGIVHRDVKPSNIMLATSGGREVVKVLDFGLARALHDARLTRPGAPVGTSAYMAPEQALGAKGVDHRADLYSVGATLYELLSGGRLPYGEDPDEIDEARFTRDPTPLGHLVAGIAPELADVVARAMAREPDDRYESAAELGRALAATRRQPPAAAAAATPKATAAERASRARELVDKVVRAAERGGGLPALPAVGAELMRLVHQPAEEVELPEVAALVERDPGLSASLLRLANSPYFGVAGRVTAVRHALSVVGLEGASEALRYYLVRRALPAPPDLDGLPADGFWAHSWAAAIAARALGRPDLLVTALPGALYSAGLLHDVGKLLLAAGLPAEYEKCLVLARQDGIDLWLVEAEELGTGHAEVGRLLLESWQLPSSIVDAVAWHHEPGRAPAPAQEAAGLVQLADRLVNGKAATASGNPAPGEPGECWLVREGRTALANEATLETVEAEVSALLERQAAVLSEGEPEGPPRPEAAPRRASRSGKSSAAEPKQGLLGRIGSALRRIFG